VAGSGSAHLRNAADAVLRAEDVVIEYKIGKDLKVQAVSKVSIDLLQGETVAVVGESGCGKSTLGKGLLRLLPVSSGSITLEGTDIVALKGEKLRAIRPRMQMIFQDSISALDPHMQVSSLVEMPLKIWKRGSEAERTAKVNELLTAVGLDPAVVGNRRPTEFSGGQCQRISIARAVALDPKVLICDEPVSSLDVSVQAQILNLLQDMKERYGLSLIFISHDLAVVRAISSRIVVMYLGKVCEVGTPEAIYSKPAHHYSAALIDSVPIPDPTKKRTHAAIQGEPPSPLFPPSGCRFRTRCAAATELCATEEPQLREVTPGQFVACHHPRS
jgi:peptide/nickel transport system ATP-binding protein